MGTRLVDDKLADDLIGFKWSKTSEGVVTLDSVGVKKSDILVPLQTTDSSVADVAKFFKNAEQTHIRNLEVLLASFGGETLSLDAQSEALAKLFEQAKTYWLQKGHSPRCWLGPALVSGSCRSKWSRKPKAAIPCRQTLLTTSRWQGT